MSMKMKHREQPKTSNHSCMVLIPTVHVHIVVGSSSANMQLSKHRNIGAS